MVLCCGLVGTVCGLCFYVKCFRESNESAFIEPHQLEIAGGVLEGSIVDAHLMLRNTTASAVRVIKVVPSCGCLKITTRGGKPFVPTYYLPSHASVPLRVTIDTQSWQGEMSQFVLVKYESDTGEGKCMASITLSVRPALRSLSRSLIFRDLPIGNKVSGDVIIGDGFPDPGIEIDKVTSSDPEHLTARLESLERNPAPPQEIDAVGRVKERYRIHVFFTSGGINLSEQLIILPKDKKLASLRIPVYYRAEKSSQTFHPTEVLLAHSNAGDVVTRDVRYTPTANKRGLVLTIKDSPSYVKTVVRKEDDIWVISLMLTIPECFGDDDAVTIGDGNGNTLGRIPIVFLGRHGHHEAGKVGEGSMSP